MAHPAHPGTSGLDIKPAEKSAEKPAERPAEKPAERPAEKPADISFDPHTK